MKKTNTFQPKIGNEETAALPAIEYQGEIRVIEREEEISEACAYLASHPVIGFDTETRPSFRQGVTFRVSLLGNAKVRKVGADVAGDLRSLRQLRHFRDGGFVDLQAIAPDWGIEEKSLRKLSAIVLGKRVSKAQRLSNWEAAQLTDKQLLYAATDAWVCTEIYDKLQQTPRTGKK